MVTDQVRTGAYREALQKTVKPGHAVADLGTGTGVFAIFACQFGARKVYAIESDTAIEVARQVAASNGVADRIEFIPELSTRVSLPEPVDVIVSDLRGVLPFFAESVTSLIDARQRFLADGGTMIPGREPLWAALAEAREPYHYDAEVLRDNGFGIDMSAATRFAANEWRKTRVTREELLVEPQQWGMVDYKSVSSPHVEGDISCVSSRNGTANCLCIWFDTELIDGVGFSNGPGAPSNIYGQVLFPLEEPVEVSTGDRVEVAIEARLVEGEYSWRWSTRIAAEGSGSIKAEFEQSMIHATPVSLSRLRRREAGHRAALREDGEIDRYALSLMDGATPLREIADRLAERFPEHLVNGNQALTRAAQLSEKYSR
jgi:protein arginine N-methyltransferase 1